MANASIPAGPGMSFGRGIDTLTGKTLGDAIDVGEWHEDSGSTGQTTTFSLRSVETIQSLEEAMSVSASISGEYGLFEGSASMSLAQDSSFNSFSLFLLVRTEVRNAFRSLRHPRLTDRAIEVAKSAEGGRLFRRAYGNAFVRGKITGGEYNCLIEIQTSSNEEKRSLAAKASASYGTFGASVKASTEVTKSLKKAFSNKSTEYFVHAVGGRGLIAPKTQEEAIENARKFAGVVLTDAAVDYIVQTADYVTTENYPLGTAAFDTRQNRESIRILMDERRTALMNYNNLTYAVRNPEQFGGLDLPKAEANRNQILNGINILARHISSIANAPLELHALPSPLPDVSISQPLVRTGKKHVGYISFDKGIWYVANDDDLNQLRTSPVHKKHYGPKTFKPVTTEELLEAIRSKYEPEPATLIDNWLE